MTVTLYNSLDDTRVNDCYQIIFSNDKKNYSKIDYQYADFAGNKTCGKISEQCTPDVHLKITPLTSDD
jgi:hypothetical protein